MQRVYLTEALESLAEAGPLPTELELIGLILDRPRDSPARAQVLARTAGPERDWTLAWVQTILIYKLPKLSREEIQKMLDLNDPEIRSSRYFQDIYAEGLEEGIEQGLERGLERGLEQGRHSEAALVVRMLRRRIGTLPAGTEERVAGLSFSQLESLGEALLDFSRPADLDDWLAARG